ncbi:MAG: hypothetical protein RIC85_02695 [Gammaproteobacteria bacterium]
MTTLAHYLTVKTGQANAIATISAKLDAPNMRMDDFALMVKAVELIENVQDLDAFDGLKDKIATKAVTFYSSDLSGEDILMLTRATRIGDMPFGSEERWMMLNRDDRNIDISGDVIVGERSLEAFGERVLETY